MDESPVAGHALCVNVRFFNHAASAILHYREAAFRPFRQGGRRQRRHSWKVCFEGIGWKHRPCVESPIIAYVTLFAQ